MLIYIIYIILSLVIFDFYSILISILCLFYSIISKDDNKFLYLVPLVALISNLLPNFWRALYITWGIIVVYISYKLYNYYRTGKIGGILCTLLSKSHKK